MKTVAETPLVEIGREPGSDFAVVRPNVPAGPSAAVAIVDSPLEYRSELLMALDLFVRAERVLRAESSTYTRSLGRVPDVLGALTHFYRIEVARATRNQLLVVATGEGHRNATGQTSTIAGDRIAIDENFRVNANFVLPVPPRDYLQTLARSVMNRIYATQFTVPEVQELNRWEGVFHGYFSYEVRPISSGGRTIVARGVRAPVEGDVVEMQPNADLYQWVFDHRNTAWAQHELYGRLENIYLAQRIHQDHRGTFASELKELLPKWQALTELTGEQSPAALQEFQLDPTFGFHAEIAQRAPASSTATAEPTSRAWSVNGYGQVAEVATIESLVDEFEQTRKKIAGHGNLPNADPVIDDVGPLPTKSLLKDLSDSRMGVLVPVSDELSGKASTDSGGRKPLVIDAIEGEGK